MGGLVVAILVVVLVVITVGRRRALSHRNILLPCSTGPRHRSVRALLTHTAPTSGQTLGRSLPRVAGSSRPRLPHALRHGRTPINPASPLSGPFAPRTPPELCSFVRPLLHYYGPVRLPATVGVRASHSLPRTRPSNKRWPMTGPPEFRTRDIHACIRSPTPERRTVARDSASARVAFPFTQQGRHAQLVISELNTEPASSPVNA
jgi:hypothetical protein